MPKHPENKGKETQEHPSENHSTEKQNRNNPIISIVFIIVVAIAVIVLCGTGFVYIRHVYYMDKGFSSTIEYLKSTPLQQPQMNNNAVPAVAASSNIPSPSPSKRKCRLVR